MNFVPRRRDLRRLRIVSLRSLQETVCRLVVFMKQQLGAEVKGKPVVFRIELGRFLVLQQRVFIVSYART